MARADRDQRTEKPTPKRRREARERGQVARSPDIGAFVGLLGGSVLLPSLVSMARAHVLAVFDQALGVVADPSTSGAVRVLESGLIAAAEVVLPIAAGFAALGVAVSLGQTGLGFSRKALTPQFSRISPKAGFGRLFSAANGVTLVKQLAKIALLGGLGYGAIRSLISAVPVAAPVELVSTVGIGSSRILGFMRAVAAIGTALGLADYIYQKHHLTTALKMTRQEVKDEARQREGDPAMRAELRKRGYRIARSRMLQAVRTADVVVANPTHFSVALAYDRTRSPAPRVVAKGSDDLAARIRQIAEQSEIPIVEDPPLARYLFATTEIGHPVPVEIYLAVARLLAFIFSLPPTFRGGSIRSYPHSVLPEVVVTEDVELELAGVGTW